MRLRSRSARILRCEGCGAELSRRSVWARLLRIRQGDVIGTVSWHARHHDRRLCGPVLDDEARFAEWRDLGEAGA